MLSNKYPQVVFLEVDVHVCQVRLVGLIHRMVFIQQSLDATGKKIQKEQWLLNDLLCKPRSTPGFNIYYIVIIQAVSDQSESQVRNHVLSHLDSFSF